MTKIAKKIEKDIKLSEDTENPIDNKKLSLEELIKRIMRLSQNENPYSVSKEIEEIKSIFYNKINSVKKKELDTNTNSTEEEKKITPHPLEQEFKSVFNDYKKIKFNIRKSKDIEEQKNLEIKKQIIDDIDSLSNEEESIKSTFEKFKLLQKKWKETGYVPITDNNNLWQSYHHHVELFYDYIKLNKDLRDLDFKRNFEEKTRICEKAKKFLKEKSINIAHKGLQELHEHWKNIGPVETEKREIIWQDFKLISQKINKKRNDHFLTIKKNEKNKLEKKTSLSSEIEKLLITKILTHTQWKIATEKCVEIEKKWKELGNLNRDDNKVAWKKLRDSLSIFYNAKKIYYKQKKLSNKKIIENKLAICLKAESLKESTEWISTSKKMIALQDEWKNSPFSSHSSTNEIWIRFKSACDLFFSTKKENFKQNKIDEETSFKMKVKLVEEIKNIKSSDNTKDTVKKLNQYSIAWNRIGRIPKNKININEVFLKLLDSKYKEIGLDKNELDKLQFKNKIALIKENKNAIRTEEKNIRIKIETLKKDIIQYENNISFFGFGKATNMLLEQVQKKINNSKTEIDNLNQKIQLLNKA